MVRLKLIKKSQRKKIFGDNHSAKELFLEMQTCVKEKSPIYMPSQDHQGQEIANAVSLKLLCLPRSDNSKRPSLRIRLKQGSLLLFLVPPYFMMYFWKKKSYFNDANLPPFSTLKKGTIG